MSQDITAPKVSGPEEHPVMKRVLEETDLYYEDHKVREQSIWQKMFPDQQQRQIEAARYKTVKDRYEFLRKAMQIDHQAQLQGIREMYNDFLIKGKAKIRKDRAEFFQQQLDILMTNLSQKSQEFGERISKAYEKLEMIRIPFLRDRQEQLIQTIIAGYYETAEKLIKNFQNILNEEIHKPTAASGMSQGMEE